MEAGGLLNCLAFMALINRPVVLLGSVCVCVCERAIQREQVSRGMQRLCVPAECITAWLLGCVHGHLYVCVCARACASVFASARILQCSLLRSAKRVPELSILFD